MTMMIQIVKTLVVLLTVLGVTELGSQSKYGKSSIDVAQGAFIRSMRFIKSSFQKDLTDEEIEHQKGWGYQEENKEADNRGRFHEVMKEKMVEVRTCHMNCGRDRACHQQCPKPWKTFQERCQKAQPIFDCHKACRMQRGGFECHSKCPLPMCPKMAQKMQAAMKCHSDCQKGDHKCHHACPKPMKRIRHMCQGLNEVVHCHEQCEPGNFKCHHECPRWKSIWRFNSREGRRHHKHGHHGSHGHKGKFRGPGMHEFPPAWV